MKRPILTTTLMVLAVMAVSLFASSSAFAQDDAKALLRYAPADSGAIIGINVGASQGTTFFKEMMKTARMSPDTKKALREIESEIGLKVDKDIHAVVVSVPKLTNKANDNFTLILSGTFDRDKILEDIKGQKGTTTSKVGKFTVYNEGNSAISFLDEKHIFMTGGSKAYREATLEMLTGKPPSVLKSGMTKKLLAKVNVDKHMWVAANLSGVKTKGEPGVNHTTFTFDLAKGMAMEGELLMKSAAGATEVKAEIDKNLDQAIAFANLIGAPSFFTNLKLKQSGPLLTVKTSMPSGEVTKVGVWLRNMIKSQQEEAERQRKAREQRMKELKAAEEAAKATEGEGAKK